jgi:hypothetical protein
MSTMYLLDAAMRYFVGRFKDTLQSLLRVRSCTQMCVTLGHSGIGEILDLLRQWKECVSPEDQWAVAAFDAIYTVSQRSVCTAIISAAGVFFPIHRESY